MKKHFFNFVTFTLLIALPLAISSCGSDDDDYLTNALEYGNLKTNIAFGMLFNFGPIDGIGYFDIFFMGEGFSYTQEKEVIGRGHGLHLQMRSASEDELKPGKYTYDYTKEGDPGVPNTFTNCAVLYNNFSEDRPSEVIKVTNIEVTVARFGDQYEITVVGKDFVGTPLRFHYKGLLISPFPEDL